MNQDLRPLGEVYNEILEERLRSIEKYGPFMEVTLAGCVLWAQEALEKTRSAFYRTEAEARVELLKVANLVIAGLQAPASQGRDA